MILNIHEINWEIRWFWHYMQKKKKNTGSQMNNGNNVEFLLLNMGAPQ